MNLKKISIICEYDPISLRFLQKEEEKLLTEERGDTKRSKKQKK